VSVEKVFNVAAVLLIGMALGTLLTGHLIMLEVSKYSCGVYMSLGNSTLVVQGKPEYKVYVNGSLAWPRPESEPTVLLLRGHYAEVRVESASGAEALYIARLPNGTYAFMLGNTLARAVCARD